MKTKLREAFESLACPRGDCPRAVVDPAIGRAVAFAEAKGEGEDCDGAISRAVHDTDVFWALAKDLPQRKKAELFDAILAEAVDSDGPLSFFQGSVEFSARWLLRLLRFEPSEAEATKEVFDSVLRWRNETYHEEQLTSLPALQLTTEDLTVGLREALRHKEARLLAGKIKP